MRRLLPLLLATLAIAAAALAANVVVLDRAGAAGDDIGSLSPVQSALTSPAATPGTAARRSAPPRTAGDGERRDGRHRERDRVEEDD